MSAIIQLLDGRAGDLFRPQPDWFDIRTVAHSLADKPRFCGQAKVLGYTVAEHCVRMSRLLPDSPLSFYALLHELDEVFLPDIPGPLKRHPEFTQYRQLCDLHMEAGSRWFGLPWPWPPTVRAAIKAADNVLLATEARDLTVNAAHWLKDVEPLPERIGKPLTAQVAEEEFRGRFDFLRRSAA